MMQTGSQIKVSSAATVAGVVVHVLIVVVTTSAARPSTGASAVAAQLSIVNLVIKCGNKFVLGIFALQFPRDFSHFEVTESTQRGIQFSLDLATLCSA